MKNTLIPLDIVYLDASGRVVSIKHGTPRQESPTVPSEGAMKYAIELNDGAAAAAGLKVGDTVVVPPQARAGGGGVREWSLVTRPLSSVLCPWSFVLAKGASSGGEAMVSGGRRTRSFGRRR